ncbi:MAG: hypothetical protein NT062_19995 [Proteobacteria bacterium]|nr:hypothetical protein [Pseudomonadota bacterium]
MSHVKNPQVEFDGHEGSDAEGGSAMAEFRAARGLDRAELVLTEVACFRAAGNKVVCGVVFAPLGPPQGAIEPLCDAAPPAMGTAWAPADDHAENLGQEAAGDSIDAQPPWQPTSDAPGTSSDG